jgi:hypothetical protein
MAAHEEQGERVVAIRRSGRRLVEPGGELAVGSSSIAPTLVDQPPTRNGRQPRPGIRGRAFGRPVVGGRDEGLLDSVVGGIEVARTPRERGEDPRREVAQQVLDGDRGGLGQRTPPACSRNSSISVAFDGPSSMIRRTWIGCWIGIPPGPGTAETRAAISSARSSESTSTIW